MTPMQAQYRAIKNKYKEEILFFRLGDFYEMFFDDAITASEILGITLTSRGIANHKNKEKVEKIPMCGIPYHAADRYIKKLVDSGKSVAICDQVTDPKDQKGIVQRKVTRVVTPGTYLDEEKQDQHKYMLSFYQDKTGQAMAWLDFGSGQINFVQKSEDGSKGEQSLFKDKESENPPINLEKYLSKFSIAEIVFPESQKEFLKSLILNPKSKISKLPDWYYDLEFSQDLIKEHFVVRSLKGFGLDKKQKATQAIGGLLKFLQETQIGELAHLKKIQDVTDQKRMILDDRTVYNLELLENNRTRTKEKSLLGIIDQTKTAMGARLLREWIYRPLIEQKEIQNRLNTVKILKDNLKINQEIQESLSMLVDFERICSKISTKSINPKELIALKQALKFIPEIKEDLLKLIPSIKSLPQQSSDPVISTESRRNVGTSGEIPIASTDNTKRNSRKQDLLQTINKKFLDFSDLIQKLEVTLKPDPATDVKNGGIFATGFNKELDELRKISIGGKDWLVKLQTKERKKTKIDSLKVKYNKVFGYYIEVSKVNLNKVPDDYERKQTLVNAERFITQELKDMEAKILGADERIDQLEYEMYQQLLTELADYIEKLQILSEGIASLDCLACFAQVAEDNNYVLPEVVNTYNLDIIEGRHPIIEKMNLMDDFVANDTEFNEKQRMIILTGPNMSGKSTYLRQNALIVLMAQIGCFVPAKRAKISLVDRIFTRIGASDNLSEGESTFMVEMTETANILNNATKKSLVILDEVGRGTSTYDGVAIAWAVVEYLVKKVKAKTLFATHYHELIELQGKMQGVVNFNVSVVESDKEVVFLHKIKKGGTDKSYGLEVAKLAGLPKEVIEKGKKKLEELEGKVKIIKSTSS